MLQHVYNQYLIFFLLGLYYTSLITDSICNYRISNTYLNMLVMTASNIYEAKSKGSGTEYITGIL